ncbi:MAG TPA: pseudouridine synthase [Thermoanaerobaculia bacterium]|nr:pseudouridine synthase [Thermoanaerobaculia bacterium]
MSAPRVFAFHKPRGVVCSTVAEGGARPVTDLLPPEFRAWFAVGRLDKESEGLLLFSDDAVLAQRLMDPGGVAKVYEVVVEGFPDDEALAPMRAGGTEFDGRTLRPVEVTRVGKAPRGGTRFRVVLHEGVNREIRRLFRAAGHKVRRLRRVAVGPVALGEMRPGEGREISSSERERLQAALAAAR